MYRQASQATLKIRQNDEKSGKIQNVENVSKLAHLGALGFNSIKYAFLSFCRRPIFAHGEKTSGAGKWDFDHQQSDQKGQGTV